MTRTYYEQHGIGRAKYTVSFHDGKKTHPDGSPFYDLEIFRNRLSLAVFIAELRKAGYTPPQGDPYHE